MGRVVLLSAWSRSQRHVFQQRGLGSQAMLISSRYSPLFSTAPHMSTVHAKENVLYQVEATEPGTRVPLVLVGEVEKAGSAPAKLLASTLEAVKEVGLSIGARKSTSLSLLEHAVKVGREGDDRGAPIEPGAKYCWKCGAKLG
ncbi:MAG: hypothetical protein ABWK01_08035 [Infirmifilum sp.]